MPSVFRMGVNRQQLRAVYGKGLRPESKFFMSFAARAKNRSRPELDGGAQLGRISGDHAREMLEMKLCRGWG